MKLRFYSALVLAVLAIALSLYDLNIAPQPNLLRAAAGLIVGLAIIVVALTAAVRGPKSGDAKNGDPNPGDPDGNGATDNVEDAG